VGDVTPAARAFGAPPYLSSGEGYWDEFRALWQRGHLSDNPDEVRTAFEQAVATHGAEPIMASARQWAAATSEKRYLPNPIKFLAGGWQAAPPAPQPKPGGNGAYRGRRQTVGEYAARRYAELKARGQ
jgi:hypothetical protein